MRFVGDKGSFVKHSFNLESHFEKKIYKYGKELFRGSMITRWTPLLIDRLSGEGVKPDSLIISHNLNDWWVVEIELARRSKLNDMRDQTGKLSRVNYSLHHKSIKKGLERLGITENIDSLAKKLSSIPPKFLLIIDEEDEDFRREAAFNGFNTMVIEPFSTAKGNIRFRLPEEFSFTLERVTHSEDDIKIKPVEIGEKPLVINGYWHCEFDKGIFPEGVITVFSPDGSFECRTISAKECDIVRLPKSHKCVMDILKGNKYGVLIPDSENNAIYNLEVSWNRL